MSIKPVLAIAFSAVAAVSLVMALGSLNAGQSTDPAEASGPWQVPADACSDSEVLSQVQTALAAPKDGVENSTLARPDEVDAASRPSQEAAWKALTPDQLAFQHCLTMQGSTK